jgi:endonuclease III-like uncharacterized protein
MPTSTKTSTQTEIPARPRGFYKVKTENLIKLKKYLENGK